MLICFALKEEAAPFRKIAAGKAGIAILITGIGRRNAEKSLREFLNSCRSRGNETQIKNNLETPHVVSYGPDLVLTCGFAGGLNRDLKLGEIVFELSESQLPTPNSQLRTQLFAAGAKPAKFFCADRIAITVAEKKKLRAETGADAVEMESAAIHAICREHGIPCATVRVISDTAGEDLPLDFNALFNADLSLNCGKLALAIAKSPEKIGALMELQKKTRLAAERLAEVLIRVL
jgi:adenosylhomocysteine nucleosidase